MPNSLIKLAVTAAAFALLTGCAVDSLQVVDHPDAVERGARFDVSLINMLAVMSNGRTMLMPVSRENLYVGIGMPTGFTVVSAGYYVVEDFSISAFAPESGQQVDSASLLELQDSVAVYNTRKTPLSPDAAMGSVFGGATFSVTNTAIDSSYPVDLDQAADQWEGFTADIGLNFPTGMEMDTVFPMDSGTIPESLSIPIEVDTLGVTVVPVVLFFTLEAFDMEDTAELYYFSKTGDSLPSLEAQTGDVNLDVGSMIMCPITVGTPQATLPGLQRQRSYGMRVTPNLSAGTYLIYGDKERENAGAISIFDMRGTRVKMFRLDAGTGRYSFTWNGTNERGSPLSSGTYIVKLRAGRQKEAATITIIRQ